MNWRLAIGAALLVCVPAWAQDAATPAGETPAEPEKEIVSPFPNQTETVSYAIGFQYGKSAKTMEAELNMDRLVEGIRDGYSGAEQKLSDEAIEKAFMDLQEDLMAKRTTRMQKLAEENKAASEKFLEENAKKPGVITLPSGLQYKVIEQGTGESPTAANRVTVHYTGKLIDGTVFDSSVERGQSAQFNVAQVIPGWTEGIQLMKVGAKYEFYIPPSLAYGEMGAGELIGPNQALVFEVQLLQVGTMQSDPNFARPQTETPEAAE